MTTKSYWIGTWRLSGLSIQLLISSQDEMISGSWDPDNDNDLRVLRWSPNPVLATHQQVCLSLSPYAPPLAYAHLYVHSCVLTLTLSNKKINIFLKRVIEFIDLLFKNILVVIACQSPWSGIYPVPENYTVSKYDLLCNNFFYNMISRTVMCWTTVFDVT